MPGLFITPCPSGCCSTGGCDSCRVSAMTITAPPPCTHGTPHGTFCQSCYDESVGAVFCPHMRRLPDMCPHCLGVA
jgi:hypothetical protein